MIISEYPFEVNLGFDDLSAKYPQLRDSSFLMDLETKNQTYIAEVTINQVCKDLDIQIFDLNQNLVQPKIKVNTLQNHFYLENYYLLFDLDQDKFIFGERD